MSKFIEIQITMQQPDTEATHAPMCVNIDNITSVYEDAFGHPILTLSDGKVYQLFTKYTDLVALLPK